MKEHLHLLCAEQSWSIVYYFVIYWIFTDAYHNSYLRREPEDTKSHDAERDIFNEKPSKEDIISATEASGYSSFVIYVYIVKTVYI